jgi:hypothetical protein
MDDVRFLGGHGTNGLDGKRINPYNANHTADPEIHRRWDAQYPSLWVTDNGGGTFANIWTPDTFGQAGLYVSRTATPGRVYELSSEHHVRNEIKLNQVSNWAFYALQTEEESGESPFASSLEITDSSNLAIANYHGYRVVRSFQPFPYAILLTRSHDIRFRNVHVDSNSAIAQCNAEGDCRQLVRASKVSFDNAMSIRTATPKCEITNLPGSMHLARLFLLHRITASNNLRTVSSISQAVQWMRPGNCISSMLIGSVFTNGRPKPRTSPLFATIRSIR